MPQIPLTASPYVTTVVRTKPQIALARPAFREVALPLRSSGEYRTDFGRSEALAVGNGKDGLIAFGLDGREKALHFLLGEEGDGAVLFSWCW